MTCKGAGTQSKKGCKKPSSIFWRVLVSCLAGAPDKIWTWRKTMSLPASWSLPSSGTIWHEISNWFYSDWPYSTSCIPVRSSKTSEETFSMTRNSSVYGLTPAPSFPKTYSTLSKVSSFPWSKESLTAAKRKKLESPASATRVLSSHEPCQKLTWARQVCWSKVLSTWFSGN